MKVSYNINSMNELQTCIHKNLEMSQAELERINACFKPKNINKKEFLLTSNTICNELVFIKSGYLRLFDIVEGKDITLWIGSSNSFITSLTSFVFGTTSNWSIQALTDCELLTITKSTHLQLLKDSHSWLEFDNVLLSRSYALLEKNMFDQLHLSARQRFDHLFNENPNLFNDIPLQYIASMLGIAPETLSRLRSST